MGLSLSSLISLRRRTTIEATTATTMRVGRTYIANSGSAITLTLPPVAAVGDRVVIVGKGAGLVTIGQAAGQQIRHLTTDTTAGTGGTLAAGAVRDSIELVCTTAPGIWTSRAIKGTWTVA